MTGSFKAVSVNPAFKGGGSGSQYEGLEPAKETALWDTAALKSPLPEPDDYEVEPDPRCRGRSCGGTVEVTNYGYHVCTVCRLVQ